MKKKSIKPVIDKYMDYSDTQKKIINACQQSLYFEGIVDVTQLSAEIVQAELFNLQLDGIVAQDFTGMWQVQ